MPTVIPYVPQQITVHLGAPSSNAENVTVTFSDYVKNVTSSEIYPTWNDSAIRANILAIVSFALNRVYTEFYRSRGYDFDITSSTAFDQAFIKGRSYFENISRMVDEFFNDYLRRPGFVEPLAAKFCNGTTVTCEGLSQWGSQNLARQGYSSDQIITNYYGNVETVVDAPIRGYISSYPGEPVKKGTSGPNVVIIQTSLNRIAQSYPAIPKIPTIDGIFGIKTEATVIAFQKIFDLTPDGIVGPGTWYSIVRIYTAVTRLSELRSQGQQFYAINWSAPNSLSINSTGEKVRQLQYMLAVMSEYIQQIPNLSIDGIFGPNTRSAVLAAQRWFRLPETGSVDAQTWNRIYDQYSGIETTSFRDNTVFPNSSSVSSLPAFAHEYNRLNTRRKGRHNHFPIEMVSFTTFSQFPGYDLVKGMQDPVSQEVIR